MELGHPNQINQDWFMRHKWFFAAIVFVIVGAGIIFQIQTDYRRRNIDTSSPAHVVKDQSTQVSDPRLTTDGWYINEPLGFQIKIPKDVKIQSEHNDEYNRLTHFRGSELDFEVRLRDYSGNIENYIFLEGETPQKGTVDGKQAVILKSDGYCDGPGCGSAYVNNAVKAKPDGDVYNIIFYGDKVMSAQESQILSTFKFTDSSISDRTYTNFKYGYQFEYNSGWRVYDSKKDRINIIPADAEFDDAAGGIGYLGIWLGIEVYDNPDNLSYEEWRKRSEVYYSKSEVDNANNEEGPGFKYSEREVLVDRIRSLRASISGEGGWSDYVMVSNNGKIYVIYIGSEISNLYEPERNFFDGMLKTFKFTE